jgi:hypothetical protein
MIGLDQNNSIAQVNVKVVKLIDDDFPGWVECQLIDVMGQSHVFRDKIPIFSAELSVDSTLPHTGIIRCRVLETNDDRIIIDTDMPDGVESISGQTRFSVAPTEVS